MIFKRTVTPGKLGKRRQVKMLGTVGNRSSSIFRGEMGLNKKKFNQIFFYFFVRILARNSVRSGRWSRSVSPSLRPSQSCPQDVCHILKESSTTATTSTTTAATTTTTKIGQISTRIDCRKDYINHSTVYFHVLINTLVLLCTFFML